MGSVIAGDRGDKLGEVVVERNWGRESERCKGLGVGNAIPSPGCQGSKILLLLYTNEGFSNAYPAIYQPSLIIYNQQGLK